jgi:predicted nucleic acid-binding protein
LSTPKEACVDAALAIAAVLQVDQNHPVAVAFIAKLVKDNVRLCAPALFEYECNSVLRLKVASAKISAAEAIRARSILDAFGVTAEYDPRDLPRAYQIATEYHQFRAYDAAYAAHAESRGIKFYTIDEPFFEAVNGSKLPHGAPRLKFVELVK